MARNFDKIEVEYLCRRQYYFRNTGKRGSNMEIKRYMNGKAVSREELKSFALMTPELEHAVRDARRRAEAMMSVKTGQMPDDASEMRADG